MYVRTKDGVYEVKVNKYHELVYCKNNQIVLSCNIIKQSENLDELCDEFVLINNNVFTIPQIITHTNFQNTKAYREDYGKFETIYGAIWCEFGLKYVAKLNSKGELELI